MGRAGKRILKSLHFHVSHTLTVRKWLVQCSELCEGYMFAMHSVILWMCTWLRKGLSLYLNLNPMENLNTGARHAEERVGAAGAGQQIPRNVKGN